MRKLAAVSLVVALGAASGCYARVGGGMHVRASPLAVVATAITVAAIANAVTAPPPPVAHVEYYAYGAQPGQVWVNGRYINRGGQWQWQAGYWQADRPGAYWIQGAWTPRGNQYVWVDGYWAAPREGYVYTDGSWDWRGNGYVWSPGVWEVDRPGHVYIGGSWNTNGGRRTWSRGGWYRDDGRASWGRYRARGRVRIR